MEFIISLSADEIMLKLTSTLNDLLEMSERHDENLKKIYKMYKIRTIVYSDEFVKVVYELLKYKFNDLQEKIDSG